MLRSVAVLPWKHNLLILNKKLDDESVLFYAQEDISKGVEFDPLMMQAGYNAFAIVLNNGVIKEKKIC